MIINRCKRKDSIFSILFVLAIAIIGCTPTDAGKVANDSLSQQGGEALDMTIKLTSTAFEHKGAIPDAYTCKGKNLSPNLSWSDNPEGTKSFALIMDDPDAPMGTWVHWVLYNIPSSITTLDDGSSASDTGMKTGVNSWRKADYGGPCPPTGQHRYFFKLYALDTLMDAQEEYTKAELIHAMQGHVLATGELMGTFSK